MRTFDYEKVKDPQYFCDGRREAHSDHVYYASGQERDAGRSSFTESLNGLWKFHYAKNYYSTVPGFETEEYHCAHWDDIYVPAHIQMEGYDVPQYANTQYPWEGREDIRPGQIPEYFNPVGSYVKYFTVPERMKGQRLFISFQGAESALAVWLNGKFVGYSEDSFTPAEFELTEYVKEGENKLAAQVFKWSAGSWCEDQDFYRFSGIYRDVYLYTVPQTHICDLKIHAVPDETLTTGALTISARTWGEGKAKFTLSYEGEVCFEEEKELTGEDTYKWEVAKPALWSAETPNLYDLTVEVFTADGTLCELIPERVGFRRFEIKGNIMMINGKRIVFKGVNRHEFSSVTGRRVSREETLKDIVTMKQNNINAIRTSHYPNSSEIYRLCDEYGLYMIDEANLESHGSWDTVRDTEDYDYVVPYNKPEWLEMMLDRANSMYQRDKNHPSVLIWSCGNEAFGGKDIYEMSELFRREDPTRLVHYEGVFHDRTYNGTSDIESQMYSSVEFIKEFLDKDRSKPLICCEYTHAMGNSCGGMHKYTDLTDTEPLYQGGFIWDYIDQTIGKTDRYGRGFQAFGGDFGERPTDYNFSANGIVYGGDREPSPKMQEVKYNYQNISIEVFEGSAIIHNRNLFVDTSDFDCVVTIEREGELLEQALWMTDVEPGCSAQLPLPLSLPGEEGEYAITVSFRLKEDTLWAQAGHEIAFGQGIFTKCQGIISDTPLAVKRPLQTIYGRWNLGVRGEEFEALFSYSYGGLVSYRYGGKEMLKAIPKPNFWRAPIDNDCGNRMMNRYGQWKLASMYLTHNHQADDVKRPEEMNPVVKEQDGCVEVIYHYWMPTKPASECYLSYRVYGDGTVKVTLSYDPVKELGDMPEFGVMFKMDADYNTLEWYGNGPEETYADRKRGAKLGLYRNKVTDNLARYMVPQECGNKTDVRYAKVTDQKGRGLIFAGDKIHFSALPYTPHELENAMHSFELPQIHYTVIRAALSQMGVGGDNSWGARTHKEYLLDASKRMEFAFYFKGI